MTVREVQNGQVEFKEAEAGAKTRSTIEYHEYRMPGGWPADDAF
jgi:hypothetical protein